MQKNILKTHTQKKINTKKNYPSLSVAAAAATAAELS